MYHIWIEVTGFHGSVTIGIFSPVIHYFMTSSVQRYKRVAHLGFEPGAGLVCKGKVLPITGHEGPEGEYRYSPTLSWPGRLGGGRWLAPRPGRFTPGKDPVPIVQEAGWAPGPVWTGTENLASTGIRSPDRPARSESLYRLSYPGPLAQYVLHSIKSPPELHVFLSCLRSKYQYGSHINLRAVDSISAA